MSELVAARREPLASGTRTFLLILGGQVVSTFGSGLSAFGLGLWVYQKTGLVTQFALMGLCAYLPGILFSPAAGVLADRWDRRRAMMLSDAGEASTTLSIAALLFAGRLSLPWLYLLMGIASLFSALRWPAYSAATTLLVPKAQLGRASGLDQFGQAASQMLAPAAAGFLVAAIHVDGLLWIDAASFLVSLGLLGAVRLPRPAAPHAEAAAPAVSLGGQMQVGWRFLAARPGLLGLLLYLGMINLLVGFDMALATPLVLAIASPAALGVVLSFVSAGLLAGSVLMSTHGGPRRRLDGVLGFGALYALAFLAVGLRASVPAIAAASFLVTFTIPMINGCSQAIWQTKVPPAFQGRVFALRRMIAQATVPVAFLAAGPLADRVCKPLMAAGGPLAGSAGRLLGTGAGRGIGLLYVVLGALALAAGLTAWVTPRFRHIEDELPDHVEDS